MCFFFQSFLLWHVATKVVKIVRLSEEDANMGILAWREVSQDCFVNLWVFHVIPGNEYLFLAKIGARAPVGPFPCAILF